MTAPPWMQLYGERAYVEAAFRTCRRIQRSRGVGFFLGTMLLEERYRDAVHAFYAFAALVDDAVDEPPGRPDAQAAEAIDAVARELDEALAGKASSDVLVALVEVLERHAISPQPLRDLLAGMRTDLVVTRYPTYADLEVYCEAVAVTIGDVLMQLLRVDDPVARGRARELAMGLQLTNVVRDVSADVDRGRIYLPLEELRRFDVTEAEILERRHSERMKRLMEFQVERARGCFARGRALAHDVPTGGAGVLVVASLYEAVLDGIAARDYDVFKGRVTVSLPRKLALGARAIAGFASAR